MTCHGYPDLALKPHVFDLLDRIWPGLPAAFDRAATIGASLVDVSTPFVVRDGTRVVAHAGVIELPLLLGGRLVSAAGIHAVCTDPESRGRGLFRRVMDEALRHCDERTDLVLLFGDPPLYERLGFRLLSQHLFHLPVESRGDGPGDLRPLSHTRTADVRLVARFLKARTPLSDVYSHVDPGWLFLINLMLANTDFSVLRHAPDLSAILAYEIHGEVLVLHDVIAPRLPALDDILDVIGARVREVRFGFTPDCFTSDAVATPRTDDETLLARGVVPRLPRFRAPRFASF